MSVRWCTLENTSQVEPIVWDFPWIAIMINRFDMLDLFTIIHVCICIHYLGCFSMNCHGLSAWEWSNRKNAGKYWGARKFASPTWVILLMEQMNPQVESSFCNQYLWERIIFEGEISENQCILQSVGVKNWHVFRIDNFKSDKFSDFKTRGGTFCSWTNVNWSLTTSH